MTATPDWHIQGEYLENCNCEVLCPCGIPGSPQLPTEGHCDVGFAFHIEEGDLNGIALLDVKGIACDNLLPQKARILLMLALTVTRDRKEIQRMFREY